jgi:phosphomannomutase / phosphoglucomutase
MARLFGTNGIRGITNREMTPELALDMGKAIGKYFGKGSKIIVGRDVRAGGDMLVRAMESGLLSSGVKVYYGGMVPTPALQYGVKKFGYSGGVMITASHNPAEFNGIKLIDGLGLETDPATEEKVEEYYFNKDFAKPEWRELTADVEENNLVLKNYTDAILSYFDLNKIRGRKLKVVVDGANSVGSLATPYVAKEMGCTVIGMNTDLDPLFPGRKPEPTPETLKATIKKVIDEGADFGIAHDGDADRAAIIDNRGTIHMGDNLGAILSLWLSKREKSSPRQVVTTIASSNMLEEFLGREGISVKRTDVGSINVTRELVASGGISGFEDNGGFMYPKHHPVRDGAMTFALLAAMMSETQRDMHSIFEELPKYAISKEKVQMIPTSDIGKITAAVTAEYQNKGKIKSVKNGIYFSGEGVWFIVRKSGTEPIIRINVETKSEADLKPTAERIRAIVDQLNK